MRFDLSDEDWGLIEPLLLRRRDDGPIGRKAVHDCPA
jgi:hypothetical protein